LQKHQKLTGKSKVGMKHIALRNATIDWYEAGLPTNERKQRGHFSTPHALIEQILDACGYTADADLSQRRLLDPACGSGNFLARAAERLCLAGHARGLNDTEVGETVTRNLWGLDADPVACLLAEMQVRSTLTTHGVSTASTLLPLHIHQADSLTLPWQPCVDLLVANPPYLAAKNIDLSHYCQARQRGQADSYLLFLELALKIVRPGGWLGLVLPDPVLARANAAHERARLLRDYTLQHIWHLSGVFAAGVGAVVLIAQKIPPRPLHRVTWTRAHWPTAQRLVPGDTPAQRVSQSLLAQQPGSELRYLLNHMPGREIERLRRALANPSVPALVSLAELVEIRRGEEIGRGSSLLAPRAVSETDYPVLRGGIDLRPYARPVAVMSIARSAIRKPLERYLTPKLLVVKSTGELQAALDTQGHVTLQTLYLLHVRTQASSEQEGEMLDTAYFLLALLNSRILRVYVHYLHTAYKLVQPQIEQGVLARLPIPWGEPETRRKIVARARELEDACSKAGPVVEWEEQFPALYEEQERAIRALYATAISGTFIDTIQDKGVVSK
jgi:SAM-dependent methyltransferase